MKTILYKGITRKLIPLLMRPHLVKQTLEGKKTQTRRVKGLEAINEEPSGFRYICNSFENPEVPREAIKYDDRIYYQFNRVNSNMVSYVMKCPYKKGDILWIRESWAARDCRTSTGYVKIEYQATPSEIVYNWVLLKKSTRVTPTPLGENKKWRPNIHMPFEACRLFLEIVDVRLERLGNISLGDAIAEGVEPIENSCLDRFKDYADGENSVFKDGLNPIQSFFSLWESINGLDNLATNPWVWRIEFKVIDKLELFG